MLMRKSIRVTNGSNCKLETDEGEPKTSVDVERESRQSEIGMRGEKTRF